MTSEAESQFEVGAGKNAVVLASTSDHQKDGNELNRS